MREKIHTSVLRARVSDDVHAAVKAVSHVLDMKPSEFVREAVRKELIACNLMADNGGTSSDNSPFMRQHGDPALDALLYKASIGEVTAQRTLTRFGVELSAYLDDPIETLSEAQIFARLAAAQGDASDQEYLAAVLSQLAAHYRRHKMEDTASDMDGQCLSIIDRLANRGVESAGELLQMLAEHYSPEILKRARDYSEILEGAEYAG